ncbi:MAG: RNA-binding protein [Candidatus Magnetobacterium sp. LHC-1]|uniref:RNA-binding protein n=1 Tax=Candidatus Magnetobacterium casense TaxID=1455061 RepID=A0ABS6S1B0_9BACT|nr:RNA-binding protein [Candidatus Magnetobacterium casensis]MBF0337510.1 RNA-binding protein [Nitrospirota bacterium]MBF0608719.1 RNA-binding protein [Nitrospirota bacterium]MBV6342385.1 RNA-binding protein [Candidatus Magnetobacterium casensis]
MGKNIYVGNISFRATEDDLRDLFARIGEVDVVKLISDAQTGQPKGFGFVEMVNEEDAQKAIATLNGSSFMERTLSVAEAKPQQKDRRGGFEGKRGGGPGGSGSHRETKKWR